MSPALLKGVCGLCPCHSLSAVESPPAGRQDGCQSLGAHPPGALHAPLGAVTNRTGSAELELTVSGAPGGRQTPVGGEPGALRQAHTPRQNEAAAGYGSEDRPQSQHTSGGSEASRAIWRCLLSDPPRRQF